MHVEKLSLINFKNYSELTVNFSTKINCIVGPNGSGKTNLLDAVHYLSFTKSAFNTIDSQNIRFGENFFSIKGTITKDNSHDVVCSLIQGRKKAVLVDKNEHERLSDHIGLFPMVLIAPDDVILIKDSSDIRRKFFDAILSQIDRQYLNQLIQYNRFLKQRNALLKQFAEGLKFDSDLLMPYDKSLIDLSLLIREKRKRFLSDFEKEFISAYRLISGTNERVAVQYNTDVEEHFKAVFNRALKKDLALERTTRGIHRDDFKFLLGDRPIKKFGSQGQQKSFVIALKVGNFQAIDKHLGVKPILLLDDIFDKLDTGRIINILKMVTNDDFGQIIMTDAREERTVSLLKELTLKASFYHVKDGKLTNPNMEPDEKSD